MDNIPPVHFVLKKKMDHCSDNNIYEYPGGLHLPVFLLDHKPIMDFTKISWDQQQAPLNLLSKGQDFTVIFSLAAGSHFSLSTAYEILLCV